MPKSSRRSSKSGSRASRGLLGFLFRAAALAAIWGVVAVGAMLAWFAYDLPDVNDLYIIERKSSVTLKAADGTVLATYGDLYGEHQRLDQLPRHLPQALLATEDRRFYSHFGLDPIGLLRAVYVNLREGRVAQGGSTLTQQLAKNVFLDQGRTLKRKMQELILALWLERQFTKDQILEMYLNRVYFGAGAYGVEAAAQRYFDKPAAQLSLPESAMLIGLLKAPSRLAPTGNLKSAQGRAAQVARNMAEAGYISDTQAESVAARPARLAASRMPLPNARYFTDWVMDEVYQVVGRGFPDLVVWTTLDARLQLTAERALGGVMDREAEKQDAEQAALLALSPDGAVRAMIGGRDYLDSAFNRATQARRQPGSAFKPLVFLTALEAGIAPDDTFTDAPLSIGNWSPRNYDGKYAGEVSVREAAARSINTVAVQLSERVGRERVIETARRLGIVSPLKAHPSLALGAFEVGLLELTGAYAAFANGGYAVQGYGVLEIRDAAGAVLFRRQGPSVATHMIDASTLGDLNDLMQAVMESGTGRAARIGRPAAGKTGTTSDYRDAWFIGYTPDLIAGVWVGNDDNAPMNRVTGSGLPAQIWRGFMAEAMRGSEARPLPQPQPRGNALSSLWDRIVRQFGNGPARADAVPSEPRAEAPHVPSPGEPRLIWQVGPQPVR